TLDEERRYYLEREIETELGQVAWAPRVNVSARTGRHMEKLVPAIETALAGWETRVPTGRLNAFLGELVAAHPHPVRGGKQPRILFGTQAGTRPPRFVLFASGFIEAGYRRFIERRLREEFGFEGTPTHISVRVPEKRGRNQRSAPPPPRGPAAGARRSASRARRSTSRCACGRSAAATSDPPARGCADMTKGRPPGAAPSPCCGQAPLRGAGGSPAGTCRIPPACWPTGPTRCH